jgi:tetratricopeptide (TPR) repeat protein
MAWIKQISALALCTMVLVACSGGTSHTSEGAKKGATSGAIGGAVGGLVSSLIFGGDPISRAASGAAIGAASGAAIGAASGASQDKKQKDRYVAELGQHNYDGFVALANCNYDQAMELAAKGQQYKDPHYAVAGVWLETIAYADQNQYDKAEALYPTLEKNDPDLLDRKDTERELRDAVRQLRNIRVDFGRSAQCEA